MEFLEGRNLSLEIMQNQLPLEAIDALVWNSLNPS